MPPRVAAPLPGSSEVLLTEPPGHLYQLTTYLAHARLREPSLELTGMLLYPAVGQTLDLAYTLLGLQVIITTVDLAREWYMIHERLIQLVSLNTPPEISVARLTHQHNPLAHRRA